MNIWMNLAFMAVLILGPGFIAAIAAILLWCYRRVFEGKDFVPPKGRYRENLDFNWVMQFAIIGGGFFGILGLITTCSIQTGIGM